jgi:hypothetical protein
MRAPNMATATQPRVSPGILLEDVTWADYEAQLRIIGTAASG